MDSAWTWTRVVEQGREFFAGLTARQKLLLFGGAVLVAATLCVFVELIAKPDYKVLYSGLKPADAQDVVARLRAHKIPFETSEDGASVLVPAEKLDSARLEIAAQGAPVSGRLGFELFDKPNWAGSDFDEKVNYQRALEAELERTLATLSEVEAVRVHLVLPAESLYSERERGAKASVMVRLRRGRLPEEADTAIRQLVSGAVDRLSPDKVVVIDADTSRQLGRSGADGGEVSEIDKELARRMVETLEPVVGQQGVRASVHVELDTSSGEETQETYDPNSSVALSVSRTEEHLGGEILGGVPGTSSNLPNAKVKPAEKTAADTHTSRAESGTYAVNKLVRHTVQPAGRIKRITAALLIDDALEAESKSGQRSAARRKRSPEEMKQIEQLATATLGIDTRRGDLLAVENISFQKLEAAPLPPGWMERVQHSLRNFAWLFRYLAIACLFGSVYMLLLRPLKRQLLTALHELPSRVINRPAIAGAPSAAAAISGGETGALDDALSGEDNSLKKLALLKNHLVEKVKQEPAGASQLIQNWLREGGVE